MLYQTCYNWTLCWWCPPTPTAPQMRRTFSDAAAERGWGSRKLGSIMAWTIRMRKNKNDHFVAKHFFFSRNDSHRERGNKNREQPQASWTYSHSGSWLARPYKPTSSKRISTCGSSAVDVEGLKPSTVQQLYIYYLRPKLEYACPVWHGALLERDALALERVQGSVARSILRAPFQASKSVMFEQLTWPSLRWRREILCITLFHLILHTRPPPLDSCLFPFASTNTVRSTRKPKQLILPRVRTSRYVKSFFFRSALLWNTLPANLQNITCHRKFKKNIEAHWSAHKYSTKFCLLPWSLSWWTLHDAKLHTPRTTCNSIYASSSLPSTSSSSSLLLLLLLLLFL